MPQFLCENDGKPSHIRVASFIALIVAVLLTAYAALKDKQDANMLLILIWVCAAFFPKLLQKIVEFYTSRIADGRKK